MSFANVAALEAHVADKSYIEGYSFSAKDSATFAAFSLPCPVAFPNAYRWYIHIAALQGVAVSLAAAPAAAAAPAPAAPPAAKAAATEEDDEEFDFGEDDEEEAAPAAPAAGSRAEQAAKLKAARDAELEEAKAAALARLAKKEANQRSLCNLEIKPWEADQDLLALYAKIKAEVVYDGLKWSENCALVDVAFGVKKIICTAVIPLSLSMDSIIEDMTEEGGAFDDFMNHIQSMTMTSMSLL